MLDLSNIERQDNYVAIAEVGLYRDSIAIYGFHGEYERAEDFEDGNISNCIGGFTSRHLITGDKLRDGKITLKTNSIDTQVVNAYMVLRKVTVSKSAYVMGGHYSYRFVAESCRMEESC